MGQMEQFKIVVEKHSDGYVAYPLALKGSVVGEGGTYEEALADVTPAIRVPYRDVRGRSSAGGPRRSVAR